MARTAIDKSVRYNITVALTVALGGFLMGFDASVISGVVKFIEVEFELTKLQLGWSVASLTLTAAIAMMVCGPLSDKLGRRTVLRIAAVLFAVSAILSAIAPGFTALVIARMIGGFGVGAALIIAPMYIAEIAPPESRGRLVSFNQLNIVIGISVAFFSNYLILMLGQSDAAWALALKFGELNWRWMLGLEVLPAVIYFFALWFVPESPRWLIMHGHEDEARRILEKTSGAAAVSADFEAICESVRADTRTERVPLKELFAPSMRLVITIGISVAILQQITGINAVFFYAPIIFEQSGIGTDASFVQAILVGLVNVVFTIIAITLIDKLGRRPLLGFGMAGIAVCTLLLAYGFSSATYMITAQSAAALPVDINQVQLASLIDTTYDSDLSFKSAIVSTFGAETLQDFESEFVTAAISVNQSLILIGILGFVASFAISIGPVMWVLFSELFPNRIRGLAISFVGLINSAVSFLVQLVFPWELANLGSAATFLIYGLFAIVGFFFVMRLLPETKGKSLEELEQTLVRH